MAELDHWTETEVINPLVYVHAEDDDEGWKRCIEQIKKAIRAKVLESYRNGQSSQPVRPAKKAWRR